MNIIRKFFWLQIQIWILFVRTIHEYIQIFEYSLHSVWGGGCSTGTQSYKDKEKRAVAGGVVDYLDTLQIEADKINGRKKKVPGKAHCFHNGHLWWQRIVYKKSQCTKTNIYIFSNGKYKKKIDGVGPFDKRPSTDKLHHFVRKKERKKSDIWHVTCDMLQVTRDRWHVTRNMFGGVNILSKFRLPSSYCLWLMILWRSGGKGWLNQLMN